jgi:hypothetical protein
MFGIGCAMAMRTTTMVVVGDGGYPTKDMPNVVRVIRDRNSGFRGSRGWPP